MTNRNQIDRINYQGLGERIGDVLRDVFVGLDALSRVQFDRPWERANRGAEQWGRGLRVVKQ